MVSIGLSCSILRIALRVSYTGFDVNFCGEFVD